jgi:hypothetical protein
MDIQDVKKARSLFKSIMRDNPDKVSGYIGAARVEELDGKIDQARFIMAKACG